MKPVLIYITTASAAEAEEIARALLEARLIASANIIPGAVSLYRWQGKIEEAAECVLIAKTREGLADAAVQRAEQMHSYECPGILVLPVQSGSADYLDWIADETGDLK
ncbi:MAG: divalent-cation tolerance protein CutA [Alphaproteobacteria bacterium]|jgi:periplasmic divalent cation tolerance protein|nr:divalent-cation tolerance protein CutA [Alphaproteobacteria bacterium]MDP6591099.1 divalent-cation tolerance protein CutA [Alphaproteobacteria bacterium]MDP6818643.1 divalent-cation tolerance protein CutA [Alphaproteobacteria bacterium]|tara:strand:- start:1267 stop:1590 length:324 start_codon:yes stop_codon:yes gene_type:complete